MKIKVIDLVKQSDINRLEINKYELMIKYLENFLNLYAGKFTFKDSLEALEKIKDYLNNIKLKYSKLLSDNDKVADELYSVCTHDVLFQNYDQFVCPLCEYWCCKSDGISGKYFIESQDNDKINKMINDYFDFLINLSGNDMDVQLLHFIEEMQEKYDVKVLRR